MPRILQQRYPKSFETLGICQELQLDLYFYLDTEEELVGVNQAVLELTGFESFEKLQAKKATLPQFFLPDPHHPVPEVGAWLSTLEANPKLQVELKDKSGTVRIYNVHYRRLDMDAEPLHLLILNETTMAEKARKAKHYYETLTGELFSNISRQFRTPLNSIVGFVGLLENSELDPAQKEYATHIRDASESITATVENLLEMVQADRGNISLTADFFNPMDLYDGISARYGALARSKGIALQFMFDPRLPRKIFGDAGKITRVLRNLIDNAIKFTKEGGQVFVEITCRESTTDETIVEYAVSDTGSGIEESALATILRPFASASQRERTNIEGLGVGLHLSHKLLSVMHTRLRVASKVGKGSRFSFEIGHRIAEPSPFVLSEKLKAAVVVNQPHLTLQGKLLLNYLERFGVEAVEAEEINKPLLSSVDLLFILNDDIRREKIELLKSNYPALTLVAVRGSERDGGREEGAAGADFELAAPLMPDRIFQALRIKPKKSDAAAEQPVPQVSRATILIAEDNPINQKLLITLLAKQNYELMIANNGQEAVDACLHAPYDLVLMDIDMPVMDGMTAARLIREIDAREHRRRTPVIALTARALPGDRERILQAGLDAHIAKPVDTTILLKTIERFLKKDPEPDEKPQI